MCIRLCICVSVYLCECASLTFRKTSRLQLNDSLSEGLSQIVHGVLYDILLRIEL